MATYGAVEAAPAPKVLAANRYGRLGTGVVGFQDGAQGAGTARGPGFCTSSRSSKMSSRRAARLFRPLPAKEGCIAVAKVSGVLDQAISLVQSVLRMAMAQLLQMRAPAALCDSSELVVVGYL